MPNHFNQKIINIYLAAPRGFCAGVERAITMVEGKWGADTGYNFNGSMQDMRFLCLLLVFVLCMLFGIMKEN